MHSLRNMPPDLQLLVVISATALYGMYDLAWVASTHTYISNVRLTQDDQGMWEW